MEFVRIYRLTRAAGWRNPAGPAGSHEDHARRWQGRAGACEPSRQPNSGPDYDKLTPKRKEAFRVSWATLVWLGILTIAEIVAGLVLKSTALPAR